MPCLQHCPCDSTARHGSSVIVGKRPGTCPHCMQVVTLSSCSFPPGALLELGSLPSLERMLFSCCDASFRSADAWAALAELCTRSRSLAWVHVQLACCLGPDDDLQHVGVVGVAHGGDHAFPWRFAAKRASAILALRGRAGVEIVLSSEA